MYPLLLDEFPGVTNVHAPISRIRAFKLSGELIFYHAVISPKRKVGVP